MRGNRNWVMALTMIGAGMTLTGFSAAAQTPEAGRFYGAPTMVVAQQLGRQGYQMLRSFSSRGMVHSYFMHPQSGRCLLQSAQNGMTTGIDERQTSECMAGEATPPGYVAPGSGQGSGQGGWQGGGQAGGIYGDFLGMTDRAARNELRRRGYRQVQSGGSQLWWHAERELCAALYLSDGRVAQMEETDPRACWRR